MTNLLKKHNRMGATRQPLSTMVVGAQGVGKTYTTTKMLSKYVKKTGRPVLIIDITGEYENYMAVKYDIEEQDETKRTRNLLRINKNKPKIYRVVCRFRDGVTPFDEAELGILMQDIASVYRNGMLLAEEMNSIFRRGIPSWFYKWVTRLRHYSIDFVTHFQRKGDPHPDIYGNVKIMRMHHTEDSVTRSSTSTKIPSLEIARIAELVVENEYASGNVYYFIYIDFPKRKLLNVSTKAFEEATWKYLSQNPKEVNLLFLEEDMSGKKLYKTKAAAKQALLAKKREEYL